jgi:hypothetical protein
VLGNFLGNEGILFTFDTDKRNTIGTGNSTKTHARKSIGVPETTDARKP